MDAAAIASLVVFTFATAAVFGRPAVAQSEDLKVHIVGASVSGGFADGPAFGARRAGDTITLHRLLRRWADGEARISTHNTVEMTVMFTRPMAIGKRQIAQLERKRPAVVVAIDFPFWFAYGYIGPGDELELRRRRLAAGLALLQDIDAQILLGDLPDMTGARKSRLSEAQIPEPTTLKALNADLAAWVAARPNVHLVGLGDTVRRMRGAELELELTDRKVPVPRFALLQEDRLHPTRLGMALLGYTIQPQLRELFPEDHPLRQRAWSLDEFIAAAGADGELEVIEERARSSERGAGQRQGSGNGK